MSRLCALREPQHVDQSACNLNAYNLDGDDLKALNCCGPEVFPVMCPAARCFFCLGNEDLSLGHSLIPVQMCLEGIPNRSISGICLQMIATPCPHPTCLQRLNNCTHFMNHTASVHNVFYKYAANPNRWIARFTSGMYVLSIL